jgi:hypothetical protein
LIDSSHNVWKPSIDKAIWVLELNVVEDIKGFRPELKFSGVGDPHVFWQCHVEIVEPKPTKEPAPRVSQLAEVFKTEQRYVEVGLPGARVAVIQDVTGGIIRDIQRRRCDPEQGVIVVFRQSLLAIRWRTL